jgi:hypothetical protein
MGSIDKITRIIQFAIILAVTVACTYILMDGRIGIARLCAYLGLIIIGIIFALTVGDMLLGILVKHFRKGE